MQIKGKTWPNQRNKINFQKTDPKEREYHELPGKNLK